MSDELEALRAFLAAYRAVYMDTQKNPTAAQEADVMLKAEIATKLAEESTSIPLVSMQPTIPSAA